jgi:phosphate starvation-inducible PhoH-like protein
LALKPKIGKNYPVPVASEERKTPHKQRIRELIKKPKEKFLTNNQELYWNILGDNQITLCFGPAGVGKSYIAMKRAIDLLHDEDNKYEKIIIVRPAVEAEEKLGSLPGGLEEKLDPYIYPSYYLLNKIIGKDARERMKDEGYIEVAALAYMRGWNVDNTILVFEEAQNATPAQIKLLLTRIGFNSKFFISGDLEQSDKFKDKTKSGLYDAKKRLNDVRGIGIFEFGNEDIVRNPIISDILRRYE